MEIDKKIGELSTQNKQLKFEINEIEELLLQKEELLNKVNGALELANIIKNELENKTPAKGSKKDA